MFESKNIFWNGEPLGSFELHDADFPRLKGEWKPAGGAVEKFLRALKPFPVGMGSPFFGALNGAIGVGEPILVTFEEESRRGMLVNCVKQKVRIGKEDGENQVWWSMILSPFVGPGGGPRSTECPNENHGRACGAVPGHRLEMLAEQLGGRASAGRTDGERETKVSGRDQTPSQDASGQNSSPQSGPARGGKMAELPKKVWLIVGHRPATRIKELPYSTDPRDYGLPVLKQMSDEEYAAVSNRVRVFQFADDAIEFCYECGLMTTFIYGFRYVNGKYERDNAVTKEVSDTDW